MGQPQRQWPAEHPGWNASRPRIQPLRFAGLSVGGSGECREFYDYQHGIRRIQRRRLVVGFGESDGRDGGLQPAQLFYGRRKLDRAVAYYVLESGMHTDSDLETLEHMVDGSVNLKVEQLKTFLSVRGIGEVQARAWVGYTFTKRSFNLGSFSLEHIR